MQFNHKYTFLGSIIAFILAFSCCWLPMLLVAFGGAVGMTVFSEELEGYSTLLMIIGSSLLAFGLILIYRKRQKAGEPPKLILSSTITCPHCDSSKTEQMPTNACQYFYECSHCKNIIKPKEGDCCVYCSYGTVACPPIQLDEPCC